MKRFEETKPFKKTIKNSKPLIKPSMEMKYPFDKASSTSRSSTHNSDKRRSHPHQR